MLDELHIRGLGVIDEVTVPLAPGLTVVTGETGAGKTMVVAALELLRGARADGDQIRAGSSRALIEARLDPAPPAAHEWLEDDDDALVVSRELAAGAEGSVRSRARLGGRLAPVSALAETVGERVDVHAQSDQVRLADEARQRALLDQVGGAEVAQRREAYAQAYEAWRAADAELHALRTDARERARELDRLRFELDEIDAVAPEAGEEEALDAELARLEHAAALTEAGQRAAEAISGEGAARDALGGALGALREVGGIDAELDALAERAEGLAAEAQDLAMALRRHAEAVELDPERLERLRERKAALAGLCRKYGPDAAAVAAYAEQVRERVERLEGGEERAEQLAAEVEQARAARDEAAEALSAARGRAGERLASEVERHLADLAMDGARFHVELTPVDPGPTGADRVAFVLAANPGEPALPLAKAASGGERSRVALAVRLALADADDTPVLVFDEVDAGIGGAVATEVGRKLARLAQGRQVLCVTHLAQLAAFADVHLVVRKATTDDQRTRAEVEALDEPDRVTELSRMLSGAVDSELAAGHAAELLAAARAD